MDRSWFSSTRKLSSRMILPQNELKQFCLLISIYSWFRNQNQFKCVISNLEIINFDSFTIAGSSIFLFSAFFSYCFFISIFISSSFLSGLRFLQNSSSWSDFSSLLLVSGNHWIAFSKVYRSRWIFDTLFSNKVCKCIFRFCLVFVVDHNLIHSLFSFLQLPILILM